MRDDACHRCGASHGTGEGYCPKCVGWLADQGELSENEVVEGVQFSTSPVSTSDRIVLLIGCVAMPMFISLFAIVYPLLDVYDDLNNPYIKDPNAPVVPVFVAFLAVLITLVTAFICAVLARQRPRLAAITAASVTGVLAIPLIVVMAMDLRLHQIMFIRMSSVTFTLESILRMLVVMQVIGVVILLGAVYLAEMRKRQIDDSRKRLADLARKSLASGDTVSDGDRRGSESP